MEYLTVNEVAERLKVTPLTVRRWLNAGELAGIRLSSGRAGWRITDADLAEFLAARRQERGDTPAKKPRRMPSASEPEAPLRHGEESG